MDAERWETFEDEVEGYRDLFGGALTLLSLASNEPHYPVRYVAEDEDRLSLLYDWIVGGGDEGDSSFPAPSERTMYMREVFSRLPEPGRHVQPLDLPADSYLVTVVHVGLVRLNVPGSREVRESNETILNHFFHSKILKSHCCP